MYILYIIVTNENRQEAKVNVVKFQKTLYHCAQLIEIYDYQHRIMPQKL